MTHRTMEFFNETISVTKSEAVVVKNALALKQTYYKTIATQSTMMGSVANDPAWGFASGAESSKLQAAGDLVSAKIDGNIWANHFLFNDTAGFKKKAGTEWVSKLHIFIADFEGCLQLLEKAQTRLYNMYKASQDS